MISNKKWELKIDNSVFKELSKFPKKDSIKIIEVMESLPFDPYTGDIQKIKGEKNSWRRRVGNYRIFYELRQKENIIHIIWTERRTSKTY